MEAFLDRLWEHIAASIQFCGQLFFSLLENLHFLGPVLLIFLLALATVALTKLLNRLIVTKRYLKLEKEFQHWVQVREEAMKYKDREKGKRMARNIDQATLNRAYYDYFFEGLLLGIARKIIPIFFMFAFINEYYRPGNMVQMFGKEFVLKLPSTSGESILVGAVFWYFLALVGGYLLWSLGARLLRRLKNRESSPSLQEAMEDSSAPNHAV